MSNEPELRRTVNVPDLLVHPPRRDVKSMTARLGGLKSGDHVSVTFRVDKYGLFNIQGPATWSDTVKTFMVGSLFIETNLKPDKSVLSLAPLDAMTPEHVRDADHQSTDEDRAMLQKVVSSVGHGDIVRATFEQAPHGGFTITGLVVQTVDAAVLAVGSWFIASQGEANSRLKELTVIAEAGTHGLPVPKLITSWESDAETRGLLG
jgi:hypothetical protein